LIQSYDILVNSTGEGTLGRVAQIKTVSEPTTVDSHVTILRPNPKVVDPPFLGCLVRKLQPVIEQMAEGSTGQTELSRTRLGELEIDIPPLPTQKAIAHILGTLDDKIELNRRMNATLEAMARALFQSWFVDFDPVRAKFDGRPPAALDPATAALFPDSFDETAIGHIPHGWEVKTLGEVIELAYGKPLKAEDRKNGPVCVYGANGPVGWHDEKLVSGPGIVVGRKGNPGVVTWAHGDFYPIDTTFYVEPKGDCRSLYFLYYALSLHNLANLSADSAVPGLNRNHAYMSKQVIPSQPVLEAFDSQIAPIFAAIQANENQSRTLATLRDTLLPKLLSGELSVAGLESKVETAS
jgi:type I restriction enzyme S subunit